MHPGFSLNRSDGPPVELESQFILRLPPEPAAALREAIRSGASNIKERLVIHMKPETGSTNPHLRTGNLEFDGWSMSAKFMDLPTIIESHKSIDNKTLYKTADICQILICKEGDPSEDESTEQPEVAKKKKDSMKVDKKFIFPHGVCPPLKNCRKRRFRKTLKKKFVEAPEIEKEVKRLLRHDNEAVDVKWDLVTEEELNASKTGGIDKTGGASVTETKDLFGELSDSDDDDRPNANIDIDSEGDSNMFGFEGGPSPAKSQTPLVTQFSKEMFPPQPSSEMPAPGPSTSEQPPQPQTDAVARKVEQLRSDIAELKTRKRELESNLQNCEFEVLQRTFQQSLQEVLNELQQKEMEADAFSMFS